MDREYDPPVVAKNTTVGHRSFSYGTVVGVDESDGKITVRFDSNAVQVYNPEGIVK